MVRIDDKLFYYFYNESDIYFKEELLPMAQNFFEEWNLKVIATKTEYTNIGISTNLATKESEDLRNSKILGSKVGSKKMYLIG